MAMQTLLTPEELRGDPTELFSIVGKLGEGSYGSVHKALHKRTSTIVAIKLIPADADLEETIKEINIMNGCDSKYVVHLYGNYIKEGYLWIVMEYCGAGSVSDIMRICGTTMTEAQIALICSHVLEGLNYLHGLKKIHRDIKAGNILLNVNGEAKLADFGVAGQLTETQAKRTTVIGTPFWMAPEVIQEVGYGVLADIWSLGITCIEMAEGRPPYHKIHPMRAIFMIPTKPPPKLENEEKWSSQFKDFIAQCLIKNPNQRPSAEQLLKHPFITSAPGIAIMSERVSQVMDLIAQGALDDSDSESEEEEPSGLETMRLEGTMRSNKPKSSRRAFDESTLKPVGPQAAAARAEEARRRGDSNADDEDSYSNGTIRFNSGDLAASPSYPSDPSFDSGTMGGMSGTMVINTGGSVLGTMVISKSEDVNTGTMRRADDSPSKDYQPAFMKYMRGKGADPIETGTMKPLRLNANSPVALSPNSAGGASTTGENGRALARKLGITTSTSGLPTSTDVLATSPTTVESLQELLAILDASLEKELETTRLKYANKRAPLADALEAKKAALAANGGSFSRQSSFTSS
ncbi:uncharacterized protein EV422DRAFT_536612 [Fimicolochytrium jonesii]|uniref:uncharacterized protein n=1 Tax=Fimicolochytrium jonesii TaxID=1396493 RepID=UPI0022FE51A7|nr:uncharacterized protein EV422DRAFT_536612 [Fimicolochytrium jonesii]KAI8818716.1 hypothetical protein EV422DRAFT_536612 [Fimicolochytrium jonesii]